MLGCPVGLEGSPGDQASANLLADVLHGWRFADGGDKPARDRTEPPAFSGRQERSLRSRSLSVDGLGTAPDVGGSRPGGGEVVSSFRKPPDLRSVRQREISGTDRCDIDRLRDVEIELFAGGHPDEDPVAFDGLQDLRRVGVEHRAGAALREVAGGATDPETERRRVRFLQALSKTGQRGGQKQLHFRQRIIPQHLAANPGAAVGDPPPLFRDIKLPVERGAGDRQLDAVRQHEVPRAGRRDSLADPFQISDAVHLGSRREDVLSIPPNVLRGQPDDRRVGGERFQGVDQLALQQAAEGHLVGHGNIGLRRELHVDTEKDWMLVGAAKALALYQDWMERNKPAVEEQLLLFGEEPAAA